MASPLSMLTSPAGGGLSTSATATASASSTSGDAGDGMFGDFNFKTQTASGAASVGGVSPWLLAGGVLLAGAFTWFVLKKQFRA